jgi:hypothetical protein
VEVEMREKSPAYKTGLFSLIPAKNYIAGTILNKHTGGTHRVNAHRAALVHD